MRRSLLRLAALLVLHEVGALLLLRVGLVERLLSPGPATLAALPIGLAFYALRLYLLFIAPGRLLYAAVGALAARDRGARPCV